MWGRCRRALASLSAFVSVALSFVVVGGVEPALAATSLTVNPITWDVIGLDSNNVAVGPNLFPVGERICAVGGSATNVQASFTWTSTNTYINLQADTLSTVSLGDLTTGQCKDAYFNVEITRDKAAWLTTRRYVVTASATGPISQTSPTPRQIFVEKLVSQNRNSTKAISINGSPLPSGVVTDLILGATYEIVLNSATTTQGYEQLETFLGMPNKVFQILNVKTSYSANTSTLITDVDSGTAGLQTNTFYADACGWDPDPSSPNYRTCIGGAGKTGGNDIVTTYTVQIIGGQGNTYQLLPMLYDFSGSSFHYNSDFATASRSVRIASGSTSLGLTKSFSPKKVEPNSTSTLTLSITNSSLFRVDGIGIVDNLIKIQAGLSVADPATFSKSASCGAGAVFAPTAGATSVTLTNASIAAGATCTLTVVVKVTTAGTFQNTTEPLTVNGTSTGLSASDSLLSQAAATCTAGVTMAKWTVPTGATDPPDATGGVPLAGNKSSAVTTAVLSEANASLTRTASPGTGGAGDSAWEVAGFKTAALQYIYFEIDTRKFSNVSLSFAAKKDNSGPDTLSVGYNTTGKASAFPQAGSNVTLATSFGTHTVSLNNLTSTTGSTWIRISASAVNSDSFGQGIFLDDMTFTGCQQPDPEPTFSKSFSPDPIKNGETSTLTFTIANTAVGSVDLTSVSFNDTLPAGMVVADLPNFSRSNCGTGSFTGLAAGATTLAFAGGSITAGATCTITVNVKGTASGTWSNTTDLLKYNIGATAITSSKTATDTLTVINPPTIAKRFTPSSILVSGTSTLSFTITNPNSSSALNAIAFTDVLPSGITITNDTQSVCGGTNNLTLTASTRTIALTGGSLAASASCTFSVTVTGTTVGEKTNTTSTITSTEGGTGPATSAVLLVSEPYVAIDLNKQVLLQNASDPTPTDSSPWLKVATAQASGFKRWYRFTVTNSGEVAVSITNPAITDSLLSSAQLQDCSWASPLAPGASTSCIVGPFDAPGTGLTVSNTATATGKRSDTDATVTSKTSTATAYGLPITLDKTANVSSFVAGDTITYSYLVKNVGAIALAGPVTVSDDKITSPGSVTCPPLTGVGDLDTNLDPGESVTCTATYTVTATDVAAGTLTNTATASISGIQSDPDWVSLKLGRISLSKTANPKYFTAPGQTVSYTYVVKNTGSTQLANPVTIADNKTTVVCTQPADGFLDVDEETTCTSTYTVTPADVTAGGVTNTATATAGGVQSPTSQVTVYYGEISLEKSTTKPYFRQLSPADTITYTYIVRNNGTSSPEGPVTIADNKIASVSCPELTGVGNFDSKFDPGESVTCTATYTVTAGNVTDGFVTNTATASVASLTSPSDSVTVPFGQLSLEKTANKASISAGETVNYTYKLTNNGTTTLQGPLVLADDKVNRQATNDQVNCPYVPYLDPGASVTCTATYVAVSGDITAGKLTNTATATLGTLDPVQVSLSLSAGKAVSVVKSVSPATFKAEGDSLTFTLTVTNEGSSPLTGPVVVTDSIAGITFTCPDLDTNAKTLAGGASTTCTAPYTVTAGDVTAKRVDNTASITVDGVTSNQSSVTALYKKISLVKSVSPAVFQKAGDTLTFTLLLTNDGSTPLAGPVLVTDDITGLSFSCPALDPPGQILAVEASTTCTATYTVKSADVTEGKVDNTASVTVDGTTSNSSTVTANLDAVANLEVTKTVVWPVGKSSVLNGGSVTFEITVTNFGPSAVTDGKLRDIAGTGLTLKTVVCAYAVDNADLCDTNPDLTVLEGGTGISLPPMAANTTHTIRVTADVLTDSATAINTARVTSALDTDEESVPVPVTPVADLEVTKTDGVSKTSMANGSSTTYTITVTNKGPSTVTGVVVKDPAVTGLDVTAVACASTSPASGEKCNGSADPSVAPTKSALQSDAGFALTVALATNETYTFTVTATVTTDVSPIVNTVTVDPPSGTTDPTPGNNSAPDSNTVTPVADLEVTKTPVQTTVANGGSVSYEVVVTNNGPSTVTDARLLDAPGTGFTVTGIACKTALGTEPAPELTERCWGTFTDTQLANFLDPATKLLLPTLMSGKTFTIIVSGTVSVPAAGGGSVTNTVTVSSTTEDPTPGNNSDSTDNTISVTPKADLAVTKSDGVASILNGSSTTYTITVTNNGPSTVAGAVVTDPVVSGLSVSGVACKTLASPAVNSCVTPPSISDLQSGVVIPPLANGAVYVLTVTASVTTDESSIVNTVTVDPPSGTTDPTPGNNSAPDSNTVTPVADLTIVKTNGGTKVKNGASTTYTIIVTNLGPTTVTDGKLKDAAVTGLTVTSVSCAVLVNIPATEKCSPLAPPSRESLQSPGGFALPALGTNATYSIVVTATVGVADGVTSISNTAIVSSALDEGSSTDTDVVTRDELIDLTVTRNNFIYWVSTGKPTTYLLTVTNRGPSPVSGARLFDPIISELTVTNVVCSSTADNQCSGRDLLPTDPTGVAGTITDLQGAGLILPYLGPGDTYVISVTATVNKTYALGNNTFQSYASVQAPTGIQESNLLNNQATELDAVPPPGSKVADLIITKTNNVNTVQYGLTTTYTIVVRNDGPSDVVAAVLKDLPTTPLVVNSVACVYTSSDPDMCNEAPTVGALTGAGVTIDLKAGESYSIRVTATAPAYTGPTSPTSITNTATVKPPTDIVEANNTSNDPNFVERATDIDQLNTPVADLVVTKADTVDSLINGSSTTYTIRVQNNGPAVVTGARLRDPAVTYMTVMSVGCAGDPNGIETCNASQFPPTTSLSAVLADLQGGGILVPTLDAGDTYTITVRAIVDIPALAQTTTITNTAFVITPAGTYEANDDNNSASDTNYVDPLADLQVTKSNRRAVVRRGAAFTYVITVTNNGPGAVTGAILTDPVIEGLDVSAVSCAYNPGKCLPSNVPSVEQLRMGHVLPTLLAGQRYSIRLTATASTRASTISNVAIVVSPADITDPIPSNNASSDTDQVTGGWDWWPGPPPVTGPADVITGGPLSATGLVPDRTLYLASALIGLGVVVSLVRRRRTPRM